MNLIQSDKIYKKTTCRSCGGSRLKKWLDLGKQPLANAFVKDPQGKDETFPLVVNYCEICGFVQLSHVVHPDVLFKNYVYQSSTSPVFTQHFTDFAEREMNFDRVKKGDLVIDIGSNDGILLAPFKDRGARVLGIEPAGDIANVAVKRGIETIPEYFTEQLAFDIAQNYGHAKLVTMTNVFAHVDNLKDILAGVRILIGDWGRFVVEVPYLPDMVRQGTFDLIYHEHLSYFTVASMHKLILRHDLVIQDVEFVPVHGGSVRFTIGKFQSEKPIIGEYKNDGRLTKTQEFLAFPQKVKETGDQLMKLLDKMADSKITVVGYGAPAKMSTICHYFGITKKHVNLVIDDAPSKQNLYTPGTHIKVIPMPVDLNKYTEYVLIFAWNFADSIIMKLKAMGYKGWFIVPFPHPSIKK